MLTPHYSKWNYRQVSCVVVEDNCDVITHPCSECRKCSVACFVFLFLVFILVIQQVICSKERRPARSLLCYERIILLCRKRRVLCY